MFQMPVQLRQRFGHARLDGSFRNGEDFADFVKFQSFVVAQDDDFAVMSCEFEQRVAHQFCSFPAVCLFIRSRFLRGNEIGHRIAHLVQRFE